MCVFSDFEISGGPLHQVIYIDLMFIKYLFCLLKVINILLLIFFFFTTQNYISII